MLKQDITDTIAAISTPIGESGIGIVRISGKAALALADKIFKSKDNRKPSAFKTYTTHYGWIVDKPKANIIDEVILTVMRAPRSYTKEDIVEINCHGGIVALRRVLELALDNGCRLAEPGEFTKRAFLNGRIDLIQAEAVLDIIRAKTETGLKMGAEQLSGVLSRQLDKVRNCLLGVISVLEANIDFPEEDISSADLTNIRDDLRDIDKELKDILEGSSRGKIMREGLHAVICGKPNVGKSSLLNALLKRERSIVTSVPGTTRDTIEEIMDIRGIPIRIVDTAGILEPRDLIEKKAVQRAKKTIALADLIILVFDGSMKLGREDAALIRRLNKKKIIAVINKIDMKQKIQKEKLTQEFGRVIGISAKNNRNLNLLEDSIVDLVYNGKVAAVSEPLLVSNLRHIESIKKIHKLVSGAAASLDSKLSPEFVSQDLKDAVSYLDEISGRKLEEDLLDKIFSEFCIGK